MNNTYKKNMNKRNVMLLILSFFTLSLYAQEPFFEWAKSMGDTDNDEGTSIVIGNDGSVYTTGFFRGIVDFNPGSSTFNLYSSGNQDAFVTKLDANGDFVWARQLSGSSRVEGHSIALDNNGNIYITGAFNGTVDFNPGAGTYNLTSAGFGDIFVSKLDVNGDFVWARRMGGTSNAQGTSMAIGGNGDVYTTGIFRGTCDFDPGPDVFNLTSAVSDRSDIFISKLDANGDFVWARRMGGVDNDFASSIAIDNNDNIYTTGRFRGTVDFDPGAGIFNLTSAGSDDIFISKLDANGNFVWARRIGSSLDDEGNSIATDGNGDIYTTGRYKETVDFDPGPGTFNLTSVGSTDAFISKLDANGNFLWAKGMEASVASIGNAITLNGNGDVYTTGFFRGTCDFDPGLDVFNLTSAVSDRSDIFISKLDVNGDFVWALRMGSTGNDEGNSIAIDGNGDVYTTGKYRETVDFDPGSSSFDLTSSGWDDIFISKLSKCVNMGIDNINTCSAYTWIDGNTYTSSNNTATFNIVGGASNGCDSLVTLNLTINSSTTGTDVISACDSYAWIDGNTYTSSNNTATHTLTNTAGCDSVVTLDLTVNYSTTGTDVITACDSYTWIDGNTYASSNNTTTHTLTNSVGCDSVVTLDLTINTVNASVSQNNTTLTANSAGANYQWVDCDDGNSPLSGETDQSFTATVNGNYAVEVTQNGCTQTSECLNVNTVGIHENDKKVFLVYPNPNEGVFTIKNTIKDNTTFKITDITGKVVKTGWLNYGENIVDLAKNANGVYLLNIEDQTIKLVKK